MEPSCIYKKCLYTPLRHLLAPMEKNLSKHLCTLLVFNTQDKVSAVLGNSKKIN